MMGTMLRFSLNQMVDRRRIAMVSILALIPVGLVFIIRQQVGDGETLDPSPILDGMVIAGVLPLVVMALATSAFGNELEDRTLNNLVLKPVSRVLIVLPKMAASIIIAAPVMVVAGLVVTLLALSGGGAGVDARPILAAGAAMLAGAVAYATLFTWLGLATARAAACAGLRLPVGGHPRLVRQRDALPQRARLHARHPLRPRRADLRQRRQPRHRAPRRSSRCRLSNDSLRPADGAPVAEDGRAVGGLTPLSILPSLPSFVGLGSS